MAKKQRPILVSSVTTRIRNTVYNTNSTEVSSPEETVERKRDLLNLIDLAIPKLAENITSGELKLNTTTDLDRITRLALLLSGEAESVTGKAGSETTQEEEESARLSISKIEQILNPDDPEVKAMYDKLYDSYNKINDEENKEI